MDANQIGNFVKFLQTFKPNEYQYHPFRHQLTPDEITALLTPLQEAGMTFTIVLKPPEPNEAYTWYTITRTA